MRVAHNRADITGIVYGRLTALTDVGKNKHGNRLWRCKCACGGELVTTAAKLLSGHTQSCGCITRERITKHGLSASSEYQIWAVMKERCHNPKNSNYYRYGGVGITVCERWRESFAHFYADMGPRPGPEYSIDRIDNNGPYAPDNCRWVTWDVQYRNREQTVWIKYNGERKCRKDWCKQFGVDEATFAQRIERGWDTHTALTAPAYYQYSRLGPLTKTNKSI